MGKKGFTFPTFGGAFESCFPASFAVNTGGEDSTDGGGMADLCAWDVKAGPLPAGFDGGV